MDILAKMALMSKDIHALRLTTATITITAQVPTLTLTLAMLAVILQLTTIGPQNTTNEHMAIPAL
jgi:hypothetical protein